MHGRQPGKHNENDTKLLYLAKFGYIRDENHKWD